MINKSQKFPLRQGFEGQAKVKSQKFSYQLGFTFIEVILYVGLVTVIMSSIIPYAWNIIQGGVKSAYQEEVNSNARYVSERIKYKIRNSFGINSLTSTQISLCENSGSCLTNPTIITYATPNITISESGAATVNLNSDKVRITSFAFTNNTSGDNKTKNITFAMTITTSYQGTRKEYIYTIDNIRSSAEVRSN